MSQQSRKTRPTVVCAISVMVIAIGGCGGNPPSLEDSSTDPLEVQSPPSDAMSDEAIASPDPEAEPDFCDGSTYQPPADGYVLSGQAALDEVLHGTGSCDRCDLRGADLRGVTLQPGERFRGANLAGALFTDADLDGVTFENANLAGADLSGANLEGVRFDGATVCEANLSTTNMFRVLARNADFRGATLDGADMTESDFRGTTLEGASMEDTIETGVYWDDATMPSGVRF